MRDECRQRRGELEAASRRVEGYFRQNDPLVSTMALDILDQARRGRDAVLAAFEQPRPDWPSLRDGLAKAMEGFSVAQDQAEVDVRSHQQLADEYERARAELERVADLLAGRREDRLAANQRFRSAAEVLDQVGLDLSQPHGEWPRLLEQVRGAVRRPRAGRAAGPRGHPPGRPGPVGDRRGRPVDRPGRGYFAMGVGADTSAAEAALDRAEQLLGSQQYEQAIESAGQAQRAARRAQQEAVQQASWRQMQADAERRRWEGSPRRLRDRGCARHGRRRRRGRHPGERHRRPLPRPRSPGRRPQARAHDQPRAAADPTPAVSTWQSDAGQGTW